MRWALLVLAAAVLSPTPAAACTTFCTTGHGRTLVGKSYDWHMGQGLVVINKRNVAKRALVLHGTPATWTSRLASVTFNQYGLEFPNGGMNEAGLVVEIMWLDSSVYPEPGERPTVNELQWIQYQLDNHRTLGEVVRSARSLDVAPLHARVHYLVCDRSGQCGAFEYLRGKLEISAGAALPIPVLTNHPYATALHHLRTATAEPRGVSSLDRFVLASRGLGKTDGDPFRKAFALLDRVRNGDQSKWNIVYDPERLEVRFRTFGHPSIKVVRLRAFNGSCQSPAFVLDIDTDAEGDVSKRFQPYTQAANRALVSRSLGEEGGLFPGATALAAAYPATTRCAVPTRR